MKLEFLTNINSDHKEDDLIRLFDFDKHQAKELQDVIRDKILRDNQNVDLTALNFIEPINCSLTLTIGDKDKGIQRINGDKFNCQLTYNSYKQMADLLQPFADKETKGYQWLYDLSADRTTTEFLFSPEGKW